MEPQDRITLEELREMIGDDVIVSHILKHTLPFSNYSRISKAHSRESAIDLVKRVNLDFAAPLVIDYEERMAPETAAGVMLHFTLKYVGNIGDIDDDYSYARYSEGLVTLVIDKDDEGETSIINVTLKLLHIIAHGWEEVDVEEILENVIVNTFEASLIDIVDIATELIQRIALDFVLDKVIETSYDIAMSLDILTRLGIERAQNPSVEVRNAIKEVAKDRILDNLVQGKSIALDLERCNLSEYVLSLEFSSTPCIAKTQLSEVLEDE